MTRAIGAFPAASQMPGTIWTAIESPVDAAFLASSPSVLRVISSEKDLDGLPDDDPANTIACTGVPRGRIPIVPIAELKHPRALSNELREGMLFGASSGEIQEIIAGHIRVYDRLVMEYHPSDGDACIMPWQQGKLLYAIGVMEYCIGEGFCRSIRADMMQVAGIIKYFADIVDKRSSVRPAEGNQGFGEERQHRVMSRLQREMGHLQDARLADGERIHPAIALSVADLQNIAVMKGVYSTIAGEPLNSSRDDALRSAAYLFDLSRRYEGAGADLMVREIERALDVPPLREYAGIGHDGIMERLHRQVSASVEDALGGYFDANKDVPLSIDALYDFWDSRFAGAYLYRQHIFKWLADGLGESPEAARFGQRAELDARIAGALGSGL